MTRGRVWLFGICLIALTSPSLAQEDASQQDRSIEINAGSPGSIAQIVDIEFKIADERAQASEAQRIINTLATIIQRQERLKGAVSEAKSFDCTKDTSKLSHQYDVVVEALSMYFPLTQELNKFEDHSLPMPFANFFVASPADRCRILQTENIGSKIDDFFSDLKSVRARVEENLNNAKHEISFLEGKVRDSLAGQSAVSNVSRNLPWILLIVAVFAIGIIVSIKLFDKEIQMEWVSSGQVIQFTTVLILLSALMALGLTQIIKEQVLGTLLGGIAGYVLAQGVGRATARATLNATREANSTIPISAAGDLAAAVAASNKLQADVTSRAHLPSS